MSAAVKLIPRPPALVLNKNTKMSDRVWKSATMSRRSEILDEPSSRMYVCFLCHMYSCKEKISRSEQSLWWLINLTSCKLGLTVYSSSCWWDVIKLSVSPCVVKIPKILGKKRFWTSKDYKPPITYCDCSVSIELHIKLKEITRFSSKFFRDHHQS